VASTGVVFRRERTPDAETLREFTQVGVELLGAQGVEADAEVIALACRAAAKVGLEPRVRIGHVGVILELLAHSGLPPAAQSALVEMISEAAAEGRDVRSLRSALGRLEAWIHTGEEAESILPAVEPGDEPGVDRLFRQLVPDVMGRRSGHEVVARLRRKWELAHGLEHVLTRLESELASIAQLRGPASDVLTKLEKEQARLAPETAKSLGDLLRLLDSAGIDPARIDLDLGFGRGIGFYSQTIFELSVSNGAESIEICGGGRYDGLARVFGSKRDEHGLGFAFGLERLASILAARTRSHKP
jgi:histidyl-tRNA synthetase